MAEYDVSTLEFVKEGKVKKVYKVGDALYVFDFTDKISVFDKVIPSLIPGKGGSLNVCAAFWLQRAEDMGLKTHFIERCSPTQMLVQRAGAFPMKGPNDPDYGWANKDRTDYQIPLEVIGRDYIVGSMYKRLKAGKIKPEALGYPSGHDPKKIKKGEKLPQRLIEVTTKFEKFDRPVPIDEAYRIAGMTPVEYNDMKEIVNKMFDIMAVQVEPRGLIHMDGKMEFAFGPQRELMFIDTFGTGDEDRFVDKKAYDESEGKPEYDIIEISKEFVRKYYHDIGYQDALEAARNNKQPEPDIPALPDEQIAETSRLYRVLKEMITGETD
jgi:phosphoribosylaminoimidazole-succinocarboxamide synthase